MGGWKSLNRDTNKWLGKLDSESGEIDHTPTKPKDVVNKKYVDNLVPTGATGSFTAGSGETITVVSGLITFITSAAFLLLLETGDFILLETGDKILNG